MYYDSPHVTVSEARITVLGTDYPVRNISAVSMESKSKTSGCALAAIIIGGFMSVAAAVNLWSACATSGESGLLSRAKLLFVLLLITLIGVLVRRGAKTTYTLVFQTNAGKVAAYTSTNEEEMAKIKAAVNHAIDNLGK